MPGMVSLGQNTCLREFRSKTNQTSFLHHKPSKHLRQRRCRRHLQLSHAPSAVASSLMFLLGALLGQTEQPRPADPAGTSTNRSDSTMSRCRLWAFLPRWSQIFISPSQHIVRRFMLLFYGLIRPKVELSGLRVWVLGLTSSRAQGSRFRVHVFRVEGVGLVEGLGFVA